MVVDIKITVFLDMMLCNLVDGYEHFNGTSETLVAPLHQTTWHHIPEGNHSLMYNLNRSRHIATVGQHMFNWNNNAQAT
jgi:hypothetical protein